MDTYTVTLNNKSQRRITMKFRKVSPRVELPVMGIFQFLNRMMGSLHFLHFINNVLYVFSCMKHILSNNKF